MTQKSIWISFVSTAMIAISFVINYDNNTFGKINPKWRQNIAQVFPQGWNFFTKNPREFHNIIYHKNRSGAYIAVNHFKENTSCKAGQGMRGARAQTVELISILKRLDQCPALNCYDKSLDDCLLAAESSSQIQLASTSSRKCLIGSFIVIQNDIIPWLIWKETNQLYQPVKAWNISITH